MTTSGRAQMGMLGGLLLLAAVFGSAFLFIKVVVEEMGPAQVAAWRLGLGGATVLAILAARGKLARPSRDLALKAGALALLDHVVPYTLIAWAELRVDSGVAGILLSTMPIFTVVFAAALLPAERVSAGKVAGLALGLAGVAVLLGREALDLAHGDTRAHLAIVLAAMSTAGGIVYARKLLATEDAMQLAGLKLTLGAAAAIAMATALHGTPGLPGTRPETLGALLMLGVVSTGLARTAYLWLIASAGSVRASLVTYVMPAVALLLGWAVLGEEPGIAAAAGLALICSGVASVMFGATLAAAGRRAVAGAAARARRELRPAGAEGTPRPVYW